MPIGTLGSPGSDIVYETGWFVDLINPQSVNYVILNITDPNEVEHSVRWTNDEIFWTDYIPLSSFLAVNFDTSLPYKFQIRFVRIFIDVNPILTWDFFNVSFNLVFYLRSEPGSTFDKVYFNDRGSGMGQILTNDIDLNKLCGNLLEKFVKYGIIHTEIGFDEANLRTEDYFHFWKSICCYFALHYKFAKKFEDIYQDKDLLSNFLEQRGLFFCGNEDLVVLQGIASSYYDTIRRRGTPKVVDELRSILCNDLCDELIFTPLKKKNIGWNVGNSSPLYKGMNLVNELNKMPVQEHGNSVVDANNYHFLNGPLSIVSDIDQQGDPNDVFRLSAQNFNGISSSGILSPDKLMVVNPDLDYEISFFIKKSALLQDFLAFGFNTYDCDGNVTESHRMDGAMSSFFPNFFQVFSNTGYLARAGQYVKIRGIVFNQNEPFRAFPDYALNNGIGFHWKMGPETATIYPNIMMFPFGVGLDVSIYGLRVALLRNPYSLGFLNITNYVLSYLISRNGSLSESEIEGLISEYLIPINTVINTIWS